MKKYLSLVLTIVLALALVPNVAMAARVGDVVGYAQPTDIVATINGYQLESYNVDGYTYICVEDLRYYGFDVYYDNYSRTLSVSRNGATYIDPQNTNPNFWSIGSNNSKRKILYTDITTYVNGSYVSSCNINGQTIIQFDHLRAFGAVNYDNNIREISLTMDYMNYNPIAIEAASLNENFDFNTGWKGIWRAKGNLLIVIATATSYMNKSEVNDYVNNHFINDKNGVIDLYNYYVQYNFPVSSIYVEVRNSDGTKIASYQTN